MVRSGQIAVGQTARIMWIGKPAKRAGIVQCIRLAVIAVAAVEVSGCSIGRRRSQGSKIMSWPLSTHLVTALPTKILFTVTPAPDGPSTTATASASLPSFIRNVHRPANVAILVMASMAKAVTHGRKEQIKIGAGLVSRRAAAVDAERGALGWRKIALARVVCALA